MSVELGRKGCTIIFWALIIAAAIAASLLRF